MSESVANNNNHLNQMTKHIQVVEWLPNDNQNNQKQPHKPIETNK